MRTAKKLGVAGAVVALASAVPIVWFGVLAVTAVETVTVAPAEFRAQVFGTGTVEARVSVEVGSKITGRVVRLLRDQGDVVERGELLALLENDDLRQQRDQAAFVQQRALESIRLTQANLARARASLAAREAAVAKTVAAAELARVTFDRVRRLHEREFVARQDLDVRATELRVAEADLRTVRGELAALEADVRSGEAAVGMAEREVAAAGAALAVGESRLRDASIFAPFSGLVLSREVEPGAVIVPGVRLFRMVDPSTVWVRINLDESLLGAVRLGQPAEVTLRSRPGRTFRGEVVRIGEESDRIAEELSVEIRLLEAPRLRVGEQADATIITRLVAGARVVPAAALVQEGSGPSAVFVLENGGARRRPVTVADRDPRSGGLEIVSGIADGQRVVVGPRPYPSTLKEGQRLRAARSEP